MKRCKMFAASILIGGLLAGCSGDETSGPEKKTEEKASNVEVKAASIQDEAEAPVEMENREAAAKTIASLKRIVDEPMDPGLVEKGFDKEYDWYLKSLRISRQVDAFLPFQEETKSSDFLNIRSLAAMIGHLQYVRTAHIDDTGGETEAQTAVEEWKPAALGLNYSYMYIKRIIHDLDIALNHNGEGETYGVTYLLDGENVGELTSFMSDGEYRGD